MMEPVPLGEAGPGRERWELLAFSMSRGLSGEAGLRTSIRLLLPGMTARWPSAFQLMECGVKSLGRGMGMPEARKEAGSGRPEGGRLKRRRPEGPASQSCWVRGWKPAACLAGRMKGRSLPEARSMSSKLWFPAVLLGPAHSGGDQTARRPFGEMSDCQTVERFL